MSNRHPRTGFVLFDALVAFALVALVLTAIYAALPVTASREVERLYRLHGAEFAVSILEQYRATYPTMPAQGRVDSGWTWSIAETEVDLEQQSNLDPLLSYHEVTVTVWHAVRPDQRLSFTTLIARRRI